MNDALLFNCIKFSILVVVQYYRLPYSDKEQVAHIIYFTYQYKYEHILYSE